jgi:hypothetical protein
VHGCREEKVTKTRINHSRASIFIPYISLLSKSNTLFLTRLHSFSYRISCYIHARIFWFHCKDTVLDGNDKLKFRKIRCGMQIYNEVFENLLLQLTKSILLAESLIYCCTTVYIDVATLICFNSWHQAAGLLLWQASE